MPRPMSALSALIAAAALIPAAGLGADQPQLTVYAPDYFASDWGPGPGIEAAFEAVCGCDLVYVTGDVLPRLLLEGASSKADVIMGLSLDQTARARASGLLAPHGQDASDFTMPVAWQDEIFLPIGWSEVAFIHDETRLPDPPASFEALLDMPDDAIRIIISDPRTSPSGLAMMLWVEAAFGDRAEEAWRKLAPKVLTITKGWSEAYGLFTDGEAEMVLSYVTSPAYHIVAEGDLTKRAVLWPEGHYLYTETAARTAGAAQPELADQFMAFLLSPEFQSLIALKNWTYPPRLQPEDLPEGIRELPRPEKTLYFTEPEAEALRAPATERFLRAFAG